MIVKPHSNAILPAADHRAHDPRGACRKRHRPQPGQPVRHRQARHHPDPANHPRSPVVISFGGNVFGQWLIDNARQAQGRRAGRVVNNIVIETPPTPAGDARHLAFTLSLYSGRCAPPLGPFSLPAERHRLDRRSQRATTSSAPTWLPPSSASCRNPRLPRGVSGAIQSADTAERIDVNSGALGKVAGLHQTRQPRTSRPPTCARRCCHSGDAADERGSITEERFGPISLHRQGGRQRQPPSPCPERIVATPRRADRRDY